MLLNYFKSIITRSPLLKSVIKPFIVASKLAQEEVDIYTAAILLKGRKLRIELGRPFNDFEKKSISDEVEGMSVKKRKKSVNEIINLQIIKLFENIDNVCCEQDDESGTRCFHNRHNYQQLVSKVGYAVVCRQSNIGSSGFGVFVQGKISPGDVVALYPGLIHLPEYTLKSSYVQNLLPDDDLMIMTRFDKTWIDGRTANKTQQNPYALGHKINHPAAGEQPNVMQVAYDFPADPLGLQCFPPLLRHLIPNDYAQEPTMLGTPDRSALMPGLVVLALRHLTTGDEVLMDYRLNPEVGTLPSWYSHVDKAAAERRWGGGKEEDFLTI